MATKTDHIHIRCPADAKVRWKAAALAAGVEFTEWATAALERAYADQARVTRMQTGGGNMRRLQEQIEALREQIESMQRMRESTTH